MKRLALCVVLLLMSWGPETQAKPAQDAQDCIQAGCQSPPACQFMIELKLTLAILRTQAKMIGDIPTMSEEAIAAFDTQLATDIAKAHELYAPQCPAWEKLRQARELGYVYPKRPQCQISIKDASVKDITSSMCSEIQEAEDRLMSRMQELCRAPRPTSAFDRRSNSQKPLNDKIESLKSSLLKYLRSCVPDANLAAELSALGFDALMADGKAARDEWIAKQVSDLMRLR